MKESLADSETVRRQVADSYRRAVEAPGRGCCGPEQAKGVASQAAGYRREELAQLPADAVTNSFGCGNPLAFAAVRPGETVLDLGSGAGIDLLLAAAQVGPGGKVIGVDMTEAMVERARANVAAAGVDQVEIRQGLIEELPVETASVDWVISNCVINLSPEKERVFREIYRVLKPGGQLSISDIVVQDLPAQLRDNPALYCACVAGAISEEEYVAGLRAAGLEDVQVTERLVYDLSQVRELLRSELAEAVALSEGEIEALAAAGRGKVWSARFTGRRPAA